MAGRGERGAGCLAWALTLPWWRQNLSQNMYFCRLRATLKIGWQALGGLVGPGKEVRVGVSADSPLVAVPGRLIRAQSPPRWPLLRCYCVLTLHSPPPCYQPCYTVTNPCTALIGHLISLTAGWKSSAHLSPSCQAVWVAVRLFSPPLPPSLHRPGSWSSWSLDCWGGLLVTEAVSGRR